MLPSYRSSLAAVSCFPSISVDALTRLTNLIPSLVNERTYRAGHLLATYQKDKAIYFHQMAVRLAISINLHEMPDLELQSQMSLQDRRIFVLWAALMDRETTYEDGGDYVSIIPTSIRERKRPDLRILAG